MLFIFEARALPPVNQQASSHTSRLNNLLNNLNSNAQSAKEKITVILETDNFNSSLSQKITSHNGVVRYKRGKRHEIKISAKKLEQLVKVLPANSFVRLPYPHQAVAVTSEGVGITGANEMQLLGSGGAGTKVGVIDLGFANYLSAQSSGDLPASLSILDYTGSGVGGTNHGTSVAEIVHDMAPDADLYLAKVSTSLQLEQAMSDMSAAGVHIINHSVAWFGAAFYDGTGPLCDITDSASAADMLWVNAMGNSRIMHYMKTFTDLEGDLRHDFRPAENTNSVNLVSGRSYTFVLNWDAYPTTNIDYDLYLYNGDPDNGGALVSSSTNNQNGNFSSTPYESITYTAAATTAYHLVIRKGNGDANVPLTLFSLTQALNTRTVATSLVQPADCNSVLSVGATTLVDGIESFSSEGPTTDGRLKPEVSAPNRTVTSQTGSFTGTSGSSPHVAGAAAALLSQHPEFSALDLRNRTIADAHDVFDVGFDARTGYGRISMDADDDGANHDTDNCVLIVNPNQLDTDLDSQGNVCDVDDDNDGLLDTLEVVIGTSPILFDTDDDGLSDYFEVAFDGDDSAYVFGVDLNPLLGDSDGDFLSDFDEIAWDGNPSSYNPLTDLNPLSDDTDGDSLLDGLDPIPFIFNFADGDIAPLGAPDGLINIADYVIYQRIIQQQISPSDLESSHGDIYPDGAPDGVIDMSDLMLFEQLIN